MAESNDAARQIFSDSMNAQRPYRDACIAATKTFWDLEKQADAAIRQRNPALLKGATEALRRVIDDAKAAAALQPAAAKAIADALAEPSLAAAHGSSLQAWRDQVDLLTRENTKLIAKAGTLLKSVVQLRKELADARDEARRLFGDVEVLLDADAARADEARGTLARALDTALAAQRGRDDAALQAARRAGADVPLRTLQEALRRIDAELAKIKAEVIDAKALGAGAIAQAKADWKKASDRRDAMRAALDACPPLLQRLNAVAVDSIDVRRAATHLQLERDAHADLERALQGDEAQMLKNLDALSRKRKLEHSGRDLLNRLRKAKVV